MMDHLDIDVVWTATRTVTVHVVIEESLPDGLAFSLEPTIDREVLDSRATLASFLEDITRPQPDGSTIEALCFEHNLSRLLKVLNVAGSSPGRIRFPLTNG